MWRPENWDSRRIVERELTSDEPLDGMTASQKLVEAGADAMHTADIEFLQCCWPTTRHNDLGVAYITFNIPLWDWQQFVKGGE